MEDGCPMAHSDTGIDPRAFAVVASLLRVSIASAMRHLDLKDHDDFYQSLKVQASPLATRRS